MSKLLLIGGGGHCHSVIDSVLNADLYDEIGIVDYNDSCSYAGVSVIGTDDDIPSLIQQGWDNAFVTVGSVGDTMVRRSLYQMLRKYGIHIPSVVDLTAVIANDAVISEGSYIGKRAVVNSGVHIGECGIINTGAVIEHDCKIGQFAHISSGAVLCGQVSVGDDTHVGAGSVVRQGINIGHYSLIGIGSVVVKDISDGVKAYGNPCRVVTT